MATKAQKRARMEAKRAEFEESIRQEGLAAQRADQERRAKENLDAKIQASKDLLNEHNAKKEQRKAVMDVGAAWSDLTHEQRMNFTIAASTMVDDHLSNTSQQ